ncbi:hypothetical protein [Pseudoponticoccus marisrubri]|nr:hypothetical protein [Pseudoponticoccus marisrubri]
MFDDAHDGLTACVNMNVLNSHFLLALAPMFVPMVCPQKSGPS